MRTVLHATDGKILTNGTVYGTEIFPAEGTDPSSFYEITQEEYDQTIKGQEAML